MRSILAFACIAALSAPALAAADVSLGTANGYGWIGAQRDVSPETLGQMFCTARISGDMTPLAKYFAPKLTTLLAEIPPSASVPWQTFTDRPKSCGVSIVNGYDDTVGVIVELSYTADARHWADRLNLERTPDSWLLNNVFYQGGGNLRFRLVDLTP